MVLRLTIENLSALPDGGPISFTMDGDRPIDIGRDKHVDWTLPDPTRYISGKHCQIEHRDNGYWLSDVSTNGTFLSGADHRVRSPHQLRNGDSLIIGHYMIAVDIETDPVATSSWNAGPSVAHPSLSDVWGGEREFPEPNRASPPAAHIPQPARPAAALDWTDSGLVEDAASARPPSRPRADRGIASAGTWDEGQSPAQPSPPAAAPPSAAADAEAAPQGSVNPFVASLDGRDPAAGAAVSPHNAAAPPNLSTSEPTNPEAHDGARDFARRIARGASLPDDVFDGRPPEQLIQQVGELIRLSVDNVMALLQARNEAKRMTRSTSHTMVQSTENNPLKFAPSAEDALKVMFGAKSRTYLDARTAFDQAFRDLKSHQQQTYAAMQHAISTLATELDPATIEQDAHEHASAMDTLKSRKGRLWDTHVARWKAGLGREPGAAVEQFMRYFVEHYDRAKDGNLR